MVSQPQADWTVLRPLHALGVAATRFIPRDRALDKWPAKHPTHSVQTSLPWGGRASVPTRPLGLPASGPQGASVQVRKRGWSFGRYGLHKSRRWAWAGSPSSHEQHAPRRPCGPGSSGAEPWAWEVHPIPCWVHTGRLGPHRVTPCRERNSFLRARGTAHLPGLLVAVRAHLPAAGSLCRLSSNQKTCGQPGPEEHFRKQQQSSFDYQQPRDVGFSWGWPPTGPAHPPPPQL